MAEEKRIWVGSPSQVTNATSFIVYGLLALVLVFTVIVPLVAIATMFWRYLVVKNTRYELTTERLKVHSGVLSKKTEELELYRVKDTQFAQSFFLRLFKLGNILLVTSDKTTPLIKIVAVRQPRELRERMRTLVEVRRDKKLVREVEVV